MYTRHFFKKADTSDSIRTVSKLTNLITSKICFGFRPSQIRLTLTVHIDGHISIIAEARPINK
ncbi:hypothetical protein I7I48_06258 [Histoplasma ohiense]|nr:hypothetical protein I7I48_06258 [Histoplasma ohiense (nom. inval.)]